MTASQFQQSNEYLNAPESARIDYQTRLAILCADSKPTEEQHQIAYEDFRQAVELEIVEKPVK